MAELLISFRLELESLIGDYQRAALSGQIQMVSRVGLLSPRAWDWTALIYIDDILINSIPPH